MIDRLLAAASRFQQDTQVVLDLLLPDVFGQAVRAQTALDHLLLLGQFRRNESVAHALLLYVMCLLYRALVIRHETSVLAFAVDIISKLAVICYTFLTGDYS